MVRSEIMMKIYVVTCAFNVSQTLIDCAFKNLSEANAYAAELNGDKAKAAARCKALVALREGEAAVKFLDEAGSIAFAVQAVELE